MWYLVQAPVWKGQAAASDLEGKSSQLKSSRNDYILTNAILQDVINVNLVAVDQRSIPLLVYTALVRLVARFARLIWESLCRGAYVPRM